MHKYLNPNKLKLQSKGVDSVKSRVLNLQHKFPHITKDLVVNQLVHEFLKFHNLNNDQAELIELPDENNNTDPKVMELFNYYNSWNWKFGECPDFTNSLCHKFEWGLVDLSLFVEKGVISNAIVYSDSLHLEFVDAINKTLKGVDQLQLTYDEQGFDKIIELLKTEVANNEQWFSFVKDFSEELRSQI